MSAWSFANAARCHGDRDVTSSARDDERREDEAWPGASTFRTASVLKYVQLAP